MPAWSWIVLVVTLGTLLFPLLQPGFFISDDGDWMIIRLSAFFQSLREGQFPVRFLGRLNESYGYPVANFLYPGYLYIGSVLHALGLPFASSVKAMFILSIGGAALCIYTWLRAYFHPRAATLGTVSFITLPYIGFDLYTRGSVGEILAFFAVALCLVSIAYSRRALFALAMALLILSHNSLALLFMVFLSMYLVYENKWKSFVYPMILGLGLSGFFWGPALLERSFTLLETIQVAQSSEYFLSMKMFYLVASALLICGCALLPWVRNKKIVFFVWWAGVAIFLASPWSSELWQLSIFNKWFQFPFRFLSILAVTIPFLTAAIFEYRPHRYANVMLCLFMLLWGLDTARTLTSFRYIHHPEGFYITNESTTTVHDEYLPKWVSQRPTAREASRIIWYEGKGTITPDVFTRHAFRVVVEAEEDGILQINTVYYPGWGVAVDSKRVAVDYSNPFGLMRIPIQAGRHTVEVAFRETLSRFIIDCITLTSGVLWIVFVFKKESPKKLQRNKKTV
jgi:hypothetical protein